MTRRAKKKAVLNICGLGLDFPRQATLEVLEILGASDTVVSNLNLEGAMEFLALFCKDVHTISFRGDDADYWAGRTFALLKPGKTVTFITRGHPLVSGHLALALLQRAKREGVEVRSYSAISTIDEILCVTQETLQESIQGLQTYDSLVLLGGSVVLQPRAAVLLYLGVPSGAGCEGEVARHIKELSAIVESLYPEDHEVLFYSPPYGERRIERVRVKDFGVKLGAIHPRAVSSVVLYLPALR